MVGTWFVAYQAPYYVNQGWRFQKIKITASFFGYKLTSIADNNELEWDARLRLETQSLVTGKWRSLRVGSKSEGILTLQFSSNGKLGWGRIFGNLNDNRTAKIGAFILAREEQELPLAWSAMKIVYPKLPPPDIC